jgi:PadR family transcriptional regulator PadR
MIQEGTQLKAIKHTTEKNTDVEKVSRILQVSELIDFFVLAEILETPRYVRQLDDSMTSKLNKIGVNLSYMSRRIVELESKGKLTRYWEDENRYNHYCKITDDGVIYLKQLLKDIYPKIDKAISFYEALGKYADKFSKWNTSK